MNEYGENIDFSSLCIWSKCINLTFTIYYGHLLNWNYFLITTKQNNKFYQKFTKSTKWTQKQIFCFNFITMELVELKLIFTKQPLSSFKDESFFKVFLWYLTVRFSLLGTKARICFWWSSSSCIRRRKKLPPSSLDQVRPFQLILWGVKVK